MLFFLFTLNLRAPDDDDDDDDFINAADALSSLYLVANDDTANATERYGLREQCVERPRELLTLDHYTIYSFLS